MLGSLCSESPRQLIYQGKISEAENSIRKIYKGAIDKQVRDKVALIAEACEKVKTLGGETRWSKIKQLRIMTWVNMMRLDLVGRRRVLISTVWGMSAGLLAVAVAFQLISVDLKTLQLH